MNSPAWTFETQRRMRPSGSNLAEPNFTRENKRIVRLFEREFCQNVIDARAEDPKHPGRRLPAYIRLRILDRASKLEPRKVADAFRPLEEHLTAAGHAATDRDWKNPRVLTVEEFNTVGLTGRVDDTFATGETERWANFWFGEAKRSKSGSSLGRQGQGKITYHIVSAARAIIAITRRVGDSSSQMFGKCIVQNTHEIRGQHFTHHGYWPNVGEEEQPMPETDRTAVAEMAEAFQLTRTTEPGTSWIIPFIPENFTKEVLLREFVGDFFFSILNGDLKLDICGTEVTADNLEAIISELKIEDPSPEMFAFLRTCVKRSPNDFVKATAMWAKGDRIGTEAFGEEALPKLREEFQAGRIVSVRLPVPVHPKGAPAVDSFVEVHLQAGEGIKVVEELYVRSELPIAEEQHLKDVTHHGFGMVIAADPTIAEFLGFCEVASHLQWNTREKEANDRYTEVADTLTLVRKSLPKLHRLLAGTDVSMDDDALDDILFLPTADPVRKKVQRQRKKVDPPPPPPPQPDIFAYSDRAGEWRLTPGPDAAEVTYPINVTFRFAYDRLDGTGSPWTSWHPYDFDLSAASFEPDAVKNIKVVSRSGQQLKLKISKPAFGLRVSGFSREQPLLVQPIRHGQ